MSQELEYSKHELDHIESSDKTGPTTPSNVHISPTLAAMPMAPSAELLASAVELAEREKALGHKEAFRSDKLGMIFCLAYIFAAIGQGFDNGAANISVNMPAFLIKFGAFNPVTKSLYMPSLWLGLWNAMTSLGNALGSFMTGGFTDRFGYRYTQLGACAFSIASIFLQVFATNRIMLLIGKLLNGIPMGLFVAISAGYISEVLGGRTRSTGMSFLAASPILGIIAGIAIGSDHHIIGNVKSAWGSWKLILALQWVFPTLALVMVYFSPESPTQLVKRGRPEEALSVLRKLRPQEDESTARVRLAGVQLAVAAAIDEANSQSDSYLECFKGVDLKRTLIVIVILCGPQWAGVSFLSNGLYFLSQTGIAFSIVSNISLGFLGLGAIFCVSGAFFLEKVGRRSLILWGCIVHIAVLTLIGGLHYVNSKTGKIVNAVLFNMAIPIAQFATSSPCYALSIEISSIRLRSKTQSLGLAVYYIFGWIFLFTVPYMFQPAPTGADWGTRTCWLFAGLTLIFVIFAYFFVPETKGRSYTDIDALYHRNVPARKFKQTVVNAEKDAMA